jgi:hypothetical protein
MVGREAKKGRREIGREEEAIRMNQRGTSIPD